MSAAAHASSLPDPEPRPAFAPVPGASDPVSEAPDPVSEAPDPVTGASDPVTESFDPVPEALAALAAGRPVVVVDDADREDEGDLIVPAQLATPELVGLMVRHTSGVICVAMPGGDLDRLALPPMTATNQDPKGTAYTVSVDARAGVTTGISAADRARTIHALADPATTSGDLRRPGHVFPLRAAPGGVLARRGHTEAGVDLARLAGLRPVAAIAELVTDDGATARRGQLFAFARRHRFPIISIDDLATYRRATEPLVTRAATTRLPTPHGTFTAYGYREELTGAEHLALVAGEVTGRSEVLVRVHSECLTGDVFGSRRCDCGAQLDASLRAVAEEGRGVVVYLRGHEGRGVGLLAKLAAYALQDAGADTVEANVALGLPVDARDYAVAARVLADLGVASVRLLTNNPAKLAALPRYGMPVTQRVALPIRPTAENLHYLRTKRDRMGHLLPHPGQEPPTPADRAAGLTGPAGAAGVAGVGRPGVSRER